MNAATNIPAMSQVAATQACMQHSIVNFEVRREHAWDELEVWDISALLMSQPLEAKQRCVEFALALCGAEAAGISMLQDDIGPAFKWDTVRGSLASYEGHQTSRSDSPCGRCLQAGKTIVVTRPDRPFVDYRQLRPVIAELLIVPLYDAGRAMGTFWLARHTPDRFSVRDGKLLEKLALQLRLAMKWAEVESDHQRALAFKDAIIRDVDHRAKNTLQAAAGFLAVQASTVASPEVRAELLEGYRRLHVLARLHELLYLGAAGARTIDVGELLQAIGAALHECFADQAGRVELRLSADEVQLPDADAIPLALLANELLTNAFKHAFPGDRHGKITGTLRRVTNATETVISLQIADTGIGGRVTESEGIGRRLIRSFATHLCAELSYADAETSGTTVTIMLRRPLPKADESAA